ncbi:MAG: hypothetical protein NC221_02345 [Duncaniella sp.]|nr:hypothetical protein [Duncaniella sp.]
MPFQSASLEAATVVVCRPIFQREATTRESSEGLPSLCSGVVAASGFSRASYPKSELPEAESVCSTESVGQPVNSTSPKFSYDLGASGGYKVALGNTPGALPHAPVATA